MNWVLDFQKALSHKFPLTSKTFKNSFDINSHFDRLKEELGVLIPSDWEEFYQQVDGQLDASEHCFQFSFYLLSLERALELRQQWMEKFSTRPSDHNWWSPYWIPILEDREGGLVVIDLKGSFEGVPGQIIELWEDWDARNIEYPSFRAMIETYSHSLQEDMWMSEDELIVPKDDATWHDFTETANPGYPFEEIAGPRSFDEAD